MKAVFISLVVLLLAGAVNARTVSFKCSHIENDEKIFSIKGSLNGEGGKIVMQGSYVFGHDEKVITEFFRVPREEEAKFKFAKYDIKTKKERADKVYLKKYYRFSLPKSLFKTRKKLLKKERFAAYFGFHHVEEEDDNVLEELPKLKCTRKLLVYKK